MNSVNLIGNLTKDPEVKQAGSTKVCNFNLAINRGKSKEGKDLGADYIPCTVFGAAAENLVKYNHKGSKVGVVGRIQTGSYEKDGRKVYTVDVIAERIEFLSGKDAGANANASNASGAPEVAPEGFVMNDDDIPF